MPRAKFLLLVDGKTADGQLVDLTRSAQFKSLSMGVVAVSQQGVLRAIADGEGKVEVTAAGRTVQVPVTVRNASATRKFNFENDAVPILSRFGCNSSGCHGKAEGQNGFKLSVFGFDPQADYDALTKEARGRRVFPAAPLQSLLLQKVSGVVPHGGGVRIERGSEAFKTLHDWIAAGLPLGEPNDPKVAAIRISPRERMMRMSPPGEPRSAGELPGTTQPLRVVAAYTDGHEEDVTALARFQSNNDGLASVSDRGLVTAGSVPGQAAVMASFMGAVDVFQVLIPRSEKIENYPSLPTNNFIDELVYGRLRKLNILPSDGATDAEFLRRAHLDIIGRLPTADEARRFLAENAADKRQRLIETLMEQPAFADYWALVWSDLLRVDREKLGHKRAHEYYSWIREQIAANTPLDRFATNILLADGPLAELPQGNFYAVSARPGDTASTFAQVFLGVRIACAECHHHPFDRWSQQDYYGMAALFAQVSKKNSPLGEVLFADGNPATTNPRTGKPVQPYPLGAQMPEQSPPGDRRAVLAEWLVQPDNPFFARNVVNRVWARMMGRGLVEPVDDFRDTNPPTNPELLDALAQDFVAHQYDFHHLIRTIAASRVYQLSSQPNETNLRDEQNYSRALLKRPDAEVLFDAVCDVTGIGEKFDGVPAGSRAVQLWDSRVPHYFLKIFGRPMRQTACECERSGEASIAQVLHLLNSPEIHAKVCHDGGRVARLVAQIPEDAQLVDEIYLTFYSRYPSDEDRAVGVEYLKSSANRRRAAEDLAWSLMNSVEFVFNH
ncbi:MAG: DUF1553 domain-containing protein [Planctomycetia bacterium]|nr:DUF1553 domain-containing protein [Planctomycetia bacterium]